MHGGKTLDQIRIELRGAATNLVLYLDIHDHPLCRKWLAALNQILQQGYHLEKNYCWLGFTNTARDGEFILQQINHSIEAINRAELGYHIQDRFSMQDCITDQPQGARRLGRNLVHERLNQLHRYFEDLQGHHGDISVFYDRADAHTRWHIRQLNLLCHEFETWALSWRKEIEAPEWQRPSQLMCWLNAPRFELAPEDLDLFGVDTISRGLGGVFLGVNKAVGKHHWEVFNDEGRDSRIGELVTSGMRSQTLAAGDFDIEWGQDPSAFAWQQSRLQDFRDWLRHNGFDPEDPALTIGHPQLGQVDLDRSFGTHDAQEIWQQLGDHLDVVSVTTGTASARYEYHWADADYQDLQVAEIQKGM